jgi:hypothetical protein
MANANRRTIVRQTVRDLLTQSEAFKQLPAEKRRQIANDTTRVAGYLAEPEGVLVQEVDFPGFVAGLIEGTFQAIVDSSIQQMEAYGKLIAEVSKSVDQFLKDKITDKRERASVASQRQKLLARMVLIGIHRIVIPDRK